MIGYSFFGSEDLLHLNTRKNPHFLIPPFYNTTQGLFHSHNRNHNKTLWREIRYGYVAMCLVSSWQYFEIQLSSSEHLLMFIDAERGIFVPAACFYIDFLWLFRSIAVSWCFELTSLLCWCVGGLAPQAHMFLQKELKPRPSCFCHCFRINGSSSCIH